MHGKQKRYQRHTTIFHLLHKDMAVSENRGTPKSSILIGFSSINHIDIIDPHGTYGCFQNYSVPQNGWFWMVYNGQPY